MSQLPASLISPAHQAFATQTTTVQAATKVSFGPAYQLNRNDFFPSLMPRQNIRTDLQSMFAQAGRPSKVGMGMVLAVCSLLNPARLRRFAITYPDAHVTLAGRPSPSAFHWSLDVESHSRPGDIYHLAGTHDTWYIDHPSYLTAIAAIIDALTIARYDSVYSEVSQRWRVLLDAFHDALSVHPAYNETQIILASQLPACADAMAALTDALYFAVQQRIPAITCHTDPSPFTEPHRGSEFVYWIYLARGSVAIPTTPSQSTPTSIPATPLSYPGSTTPAPHTGHTGSSGSGTAASTTLPTPSSTAAAGSSQRVDTGTLATLRRSLRRGSTVLMVGTTGAGKSFVAREAAIAEHIPFVIQSGYPGLEDKDLYGKNYPRVGTDGQQYFTWVDGAFTEAWRIAATGRSVALILEELARFDPYNLAPLYGALDKVPGNAVPLIVGISPEVTAQVDPSEDYYILKLPNGERITAPVRCLSLIATTNLGSDYTQSQIEFDAALLGRFALHLDIHRLDAYTRHRILCHQCSLPDSVATLMVQIEDYSINHTAIHNGLLRREINLRTCTAWAAEASDLVKAGMTWAEAVQVAATKTAIPFACSRGDDGYLDQPPYQTLCDEVRRMVTTLHIS